MVGAGWRMECIVVGQRGGHFVHVSRLNFMRLRVYYEHGSGRLLVAQVLWDFAFCRVWGHACGCNWAQVIWLSYGGVASFRCALIGLRGEVVGTRTWVWLRHISVVLVWLWFCSIVWLLILIAGLLLEMRLFFRRIVADPARRGR